MSAILKQSSVLLADDHAATLMQVARVLSREHQIAGTVTSGLDLLEAAPRLDPDVIVLDISMPGMNGFETARRLRTAGCRSKLVFLTVNEDVDFVREAIALGADAYVIKSRVASDLMTAVSEVMADRKFVSPTVKM